MKSGSSALLALCALLYGPAVPEASMLCAPEISKTEAPRAMLYRDILCNYDVAETKDAVDVTLQLFVRRARVVHRSLQMQVLTNVWWEDPFLAWDPATYGGIQEIQISSEKIWTPDIGTITTLPWLREGSAQLQMWPASCLVASNGTVSCAGAMELGAACFVTYLYWPRLDAVCSAAVGQDFEVGWGVRLHFENATSAGADLRHYVPGNDWTVTAVERDVYERSDWVKRRGDAGNVNDTDKQSAVLTYYFILHSKGAVLSTALLAPVVVLSILLVGSFCLPAESYARLGLCCCGSFGTVLASSLLLENLPPLTGANPIIVTVYSGLLALSLVAIVMTILLNVITPHAKKPPVPPRWLYSLQTFLRTSTTGKVLLTVLLMSQHEQIVNFIGEDLKDDEESGESSSSAISGNATTVRAQQQQSSGPHKIWEFMASFLNRLMFCIFLMICTAYCLYIVYLMAVEKEIYVPA